jgi:hypothetical protein
MEPRDEPTSVSSTSLAPTTVAPAAVESELDPDTPARRFLCVSASNNIQPVLRAPRLGQNPRFLVIE